MQANKRRAGRPRCSWLDYRGREKEGGRVRDSREAAREVCCDQRHTKKATMGLETPAVRRFGQSGLASLGPGGRGAWAAAAAERGKKGSARFCSAAGGRKRRSSPAPCALRGGAGWAAHGGCLGWWIRCWWVWWARWACLAVHPPWSPCPWKYRLCTDGAPCTPGHTPGHPQGWDVSTDLSVWQPGQGCLLVRYLLAVPGVVVCVVHTSWYPANGRVETLEVK